MEPEREEERETERESLLLERFETMEVEKVFFRYIGKMVFAYTCIYIYPTVLTQEKSIRRRLKEIISSEAPFPNVNINYFHVSLLVLSIIAKCARA